MITKRKTGNRSYSQLVIEVDCKIWKHRMLQKSGNRHASEQQEDLWCNRVGVEHFFYPGCYYIDQIIIKNHVSVSIINRSKALSSLLCCSAVWAAPSATFFFYRNIIPKTSSGQLSYFLMALHRKWKGRSKIVWQATIKKLGTLQGISPSPIKRRIKIFGCA